MKPRNVVKMWLAAICIVVIATSAMAAGSSTVTVEQGTLQGLVSDHREFRGVPFAAPPVGDLRFSAPQAAAAWGGMRDATQFASACPQAGPGTVPGSSEDCLYLNVYTPLEGKKLPVMVWIHGGGFVNGAGSIYDGATMAREGHVVVVTINYRLAALGFLATPGLAAENPSGASGNYGIMDQQQALQWVKTNIAEFGGNPDNVTIFGGSAGAISVCTHMVSPTSAGLFHKAVLQSIPYHLIAATTEDNYLMGESIIAYAGCNRADKAAEIACMRALPVEAIIATQAVYMAGGTSTLPRVNIDGTTLQTYPSWAVISGEFNRVPVLQGSNGNEGRFLWYAGGGGPFPLTEAGYIQNIQSMFGQAADRVLKEYPAANYPSPDDAISTVIGDSLISCPSRTLIRQLTTESIPVYAYEFVDPEPPTPLPLPFLPSTLGPTHGAEVVYVFKDSVPNVDPTQLTKEQLKLSNRMLSDWVHFAGSGKPTWKKYTNEADSFFALTSVHPGPKEISTFDNDHHCSFWAKYFGL